MNILKLIDIFAIEQAIVRERFSENSRRKNLFLATCLFIKPRGLNLETINEKTPYGGFIGPGNSVLEKHFSKFKIVRLHAIIHDAFGYMKSTYNLGPGYCYALSIPIGSNSCYLGHITGLVCLTIIKIRNSDYYRALNC